VEIFKATEPISGGAMTKIWRSGEKFSQGLHLDLLAE
jgi:hypothetical protein